MTKKKKSVHSETYFGPQRDFWWNSDFLDLMANRWNIEQVTRCLDAGCGRGHWSRSLANILPLHSKIYGIDKELTSIEIAQTLAKDHIKQNIFYQTGDVHKLPYDDNFFEMVTCQTLLIHIDDTKKVLKEFIRVLKPGGLIVLVEPNNLVQSLILNSATLNLSINDRLDLTYFQSICELGKTRLKEGNNSIGDLIPKYLHEMGARDIEAYLSDKTSLLLPPYTTPEQHFIVDYLISSRNSEAWDSKKKETERYFNAGKSEENKIHDFEYYWNKITLIHNAIIDQINKKKFSSTGASLMYLVSGRKP